MKILSILLAFLLVGCNEEYTRNVKPKAEHVTVEAPGGRYIFEFQTIEISGCEYLISTNNNQILMAHKGSCKSCQGANKELEKAPKPAIVKP